MEGWQPLLEVLEEERSEVVVKAMEVEEVELVMSEVLEEESDVVIMVAIPLEDVEEVSVQL